MGRWQQKAGWLAIAAGLGVWAPVAIAHTGHGETAGFDHGFLHPFGGADHVLAMVAVGLWAGQLGARALGLVPMGFVGAWPWPPWGDRWPWAPSPDFGG
ncbi:MAG: hypothetical protein HC918_11075, partial [Oscillatoriales cyanobacterium SM2_1_8]|nr:hypothetical protein [Oscillatoriales cyanobacterium SM2_1_8]